jgi:hypothetical protein
VKIATVLLLSLLLRTSSPQRTSPQLQPKHESTQAQNQQPSEPAKTIPQKPTPESVLSEETAKIIVFPSCVDYLDELTSRRRPCPFEVIYELAKPLSEGRLEVFNLLHVDVQSPLPDVSPGKHKMVMTDFPQGFYWSDIDQSVPEPMISCSVGETSISLGIDQLWEKSYSAPVYDYKPPTPTKELEHPPDPEAAFRGDDVGFAAFNIPFKHNLQLRGSAELPEIEILGVGFVAGTMAECGRGTNPERIFTSPLRDIRVVSTAAHDDYDAVPVLKAARFAVPSGVFTYARHIRIVGKVKP